jgi:alkaline phosphatase
MASPGRTLILLIAVALVGCARPAASSDSTALATPSPSSTPTERPTERPTGRPTETAQPTATPGPVATMVAAGDIASCTEQGDSATAELVSEVTGTVALLGDSVYPAGSDANYAECYDPVWGGWKDRTRPAMGNHDAQDDGGAAYFRYFGDAAGTPGEGWYSYELGAWHIVVLNSNCGLVRCDPESPQLDWLVADLAAADTRCTLAYWHHPRFTSGPHGDQAFVAPFWQALQEADADVVLVGHDHLYERFAPQSASGETDPDEGMRQFTVGTGGKELYPAERIAPNSELIIDDAFGVLVLTLHPKSYEWTFAKTDGSRPDFGSARCR